MLYSRNGNPRGPSRYHRLRLKGKEIRDFFKSLLRRICTERGYERLRRAALNALSRFGWSNSRGRMDRRIAALFGNRRGGVFIEAGAADGLDQSNTLYLERKLGWTGLLVEPGRDQFEHCRRVRGRSIVERCVLGPFAESGKTMTVLEKRLTSIVRESRDKSLVDFDRHVRDISADGAVAEETVPCIALGELLERHGMDDIDIFSLDVEGAEIFVLEGLDFDRLHISYLLVETHDFPRLEAWLAGRFTFVEQWSDGDYLFHNARESRI